MNTLLRQPIVVSPPVRVIGVALACLGLLVGALGCDTPKGTPRPSPSLIVLQFTPQPSRSATPSATAAPTLVSWPIGWDVSFCAMFAGAVDGQQLLVDVERAMGEGNNHDARLLADELIQSAADTTSLITALPSWTEAGSTTVGIAALMDLGGRAGTEYHSFFADNKRAALRRARALRTENGGSVPAVNEDLQALADLGLSCPGTPLVLEAP